MCLSRIGRSSLEGPFFASWLLLIFTSGIDRMICEGLHMGSEDYRAR